MLKLDSVNPFNMALHHIHTCRCNLAYQYTVALHLVAPLDVVDAEAN